MTGAWDISNSALFFTVYYMYQMRGPRHRGTFREGRDVLGYLPTANYTCKVSVLLTFFSSGLWRWVVLFLL